MEETLTRHVPRCRLVVFAFTLAVLLSGIAAPPVYAQNVYAQNLTVSIEDVEVDEGDTAMFMVEAINSGTAPVTVNYGTTDGTAEAGTDYEATMGMLRFPLGSSQKTIMVETLEDQEN